MLTRVPLALTARGQSRDSQRISAYVGSCFPQFTAWKFVGCPSGYPLALSTPRSNGQLTPAVGDLLNSPIWHANPWSHFGAGVGLSPPLPAGTVLNTDPPTAVCCHT